MERRDVVAQGVSWWRANKTDEWKLPPGAKPRPADYVPSFDASEIRALVEEIERGNARWKRWFAAHGIEPHVVVYETLAEAQIDVTRTALQ